MLAGERDGSLHGGVGVEVAGAAIAVPAFEGAEGGGQGGFGAESMVPLRTMASKRGKRLRPWV